MSRKLESMKKNASTKEKRRKSRAGSGDLRTKRSRTGGSESDISGTRKSTTKRKSAAKRPRASYSSSDEDAVTEITLEQKRELSENINLLSSEDLGTVVTIIQQSLPQLKDATGDEEIELDIDSLDTKTLHKLYRFVMKNTKKKTESHETRGISDEEQEHKTGEHENKMRQFDTSNSPGEQTLA
jgi:hypothetical protein